MQFFYNLGIWFYSTVVQLATLFNHKAKIRVAGYKKSFEVLKKTVSNEKVIWFHCASLGEFEQGWPLIEKFKSAGNYAIFVSFFSPSGYEVIKKKDLGITIFYLPPDTKSNAKELLEIIKPNIVVFVKYEFWANLIFEIRNNEIPLYCFSALFRENQLYFKKNRSFFSSILRSFDRIFVQNEISEKLAVSIGCENVLLTGDTRFDRVYSGAQDTVMVPEIVSFLKGEEAFVVGSSWADDEKHLLELFKQKTFIQKTIIAPHEVGVGRVLELKNKLGENAVLFSELNKQSSKEFQFLIIDNIGMLSNLYQYGNVAYVGGAFHGALHNILEPAAFGLPVIFGPNFEKFPEGNRFINSGIGFTVSNAPELQNAYNKAIDENAQLKSKIKEFIAVNIGSTEMIYQEIKKDL